MTDFTDQIAVVTGASSGIGKAIALGLAEQGATLYVVGRNPESLEAVAERARAHGSRILSYQADLTQDQDIQGLIAFLKRNCSHVDMLIHSAGVISLGKVEAAPVVDFDRQYYTNVRAPYALTQALLPLLRLSRGQIVFINSSLWLNARANVGQYAATKYALKALADSLRDEVTADGLRVISVFLGRTATPMQVGIHKMEGTSYNPERMMPPDHVAQAVMSALSLPWTAEVTDIHIRPFKKPDEIPNITHSVDEENS